MRSTTVMVPQWYVAYKFKQNAFKNDIKIMKEYSDLFIEWLYMMNCEYHVDGKLYFNEEMKLFGPVLGNVYDVAKDMSVKDNTKEFRKKFNTLVDTTSNVEYVMDKVLLVLSMVGIVSGKTAEMGVIGLFLKLVSLVSWQRQ